MKIVKNIKRILTTLLLLSVSVYSYADENVSVLLGEIKDIVHPLKIDSYKLSPKDKVTVEDIIDKNKIRISGKSEGICSLQITSGTITRTYTVTVISKLRKLINRLRSDLEIIPNLDININQDYIVIKGTVSNPKHWNHLVRVVALYEGSCQNFVKFIPNAETLVTLKKLLSLHGYTFKSDEKDGQLEFNITADAIVISGSVYSKARLIEIKNILKTQTWLVEGKSEEGKIKYLFNVGFKAALMEVDVVYVAVTDSELEKIGSMAVSSSLQAGAGAIAGLFNPSASRNSAGIDIGLDPFRTFMAGNGVKRIYNAGHVTFLSDGKGGSLHTGGTLHVKVSGVENGSLQKIDYGLQMKVNGHLVDDKHVMLELDLSLSNVVPGETPDTYSETIDKITSTVVGELDKTIVMGGTQKMTHSLNNSGTAFLRNIPVLKWFTSTDSETSEELKLIVLISPRRIKENKSLQIEKPIRESTGSTYKEVTGIKGEKSQIREQKKQDNGLFSL